MKPAQVNKLYAKLTPHEQAALSFEAAVRFDEAEINDILDNVEKHTYHLPNNEYRQRATGLFMLALYYGTQYWKNRALMMMALHASDDPTGYEGLAVQFASKLASMDAALIEVCGSLKVDIQAIKALAECKDKPVFSEYVEAELVEQYTETLNAIVTLK